MTDSLITRFRQVFCRHPIENIWGSGPCTDHHNGESGFIFHHCYKCEKYWIFWDSEAND